MATQSIALTQAQLQALITGIPEYCSTTVFNVAGQTFTAPQAVAFLTTVQNAGTAIAATRAAWKAAIQAAEKNNAGDGVVAHEIREAIALQFSNAPTTLNAFAIAPRKKAKPLTVEARAAATAKARATRLARGTESKKQKATISGNVTGVTITPVTSSTVTPSTGAPAVGAVVATPIATPPVAPAPVTAGAAPAATGTSHS